VEQIYDESNVDDGFHVHLDGDGGNRTRQSWMEISDVLLAVILAAKRHGPSLMYDHEKQ